ncbi:Uncharacterized protein PECH_001159 [Penicillium ucsense]|uniref:L-dopachrome isomerase n=1 Tax=Penicillium ucsense TaxID=2839758 RepID=A0A8J8WBQ0_9EURO|nr:Uncharacterized protein PECM_000046 [Penicillium ucsense]KAF7733109.1 Uncharacterized protein PECH_001159 [Penicillium ucsense]
MRFPRKPKIIPPPPGLDQTAWCGMHAAELRRSLESLLPTNPVPANVHEQPQPEQRAVAPFTFEDSIIDTTTTNYILTPPSSKSVERASRPCLSEESTESGPAKERPVSEAACPPLQASCRSSQDRAAGDAFITVELSTNSEQQASSTLLSTLASEVAQIFQNPESAVQLVVQQNVSVFYGGSTLPSYLLKVWTSSAAFGSLLNLRNATLLQQTLHDTLGIASDRGAVLFMPVPEVNVGTICSTAQSILGRQEQVSAQRSGLFRTLSRGMSRRLKRTSDTTGPLIVSGATPTHIRLYEAHRKRSSENAAAVDADQKEYDGPRKRESLMSILERLRRAKKSKAKQESEGDTCHGGGD